MTKQIYYVQFKDLDSLDNAEDIIWSFSEASTDWENVEVRFYGIPERLQEFLRALKEIGEDVTYK